MNSTIPFTAEQREKLREIVEGYGGSFEGFEKLPSDSYEQQLAGESLETLEEFYALIFQPGQSLVAVREKCPVRPTGKFKGRPPAYKTLFNIFNRFQAERTLGGLKEVSEVIDKIKKHASNLSVRDENSVVDVVCTLVGQEMVQQKLEGVGLTQNLRALDRLLKRADQRRDERKIAMMEKKAEAYDRAQAALAENKGGLTPETLAKIERELNLL